MLIDLKNYAYHKGAEEALDTQFQKAASYGKVKLGTDTIFWKAGLRWFQLPLNLVQRAYRRVETAGARRCGGCGIYSTQKLMLVLEEGTTLELLIGENQPEKAEQLFRDLQDAHPELQYGKPKKEDAPC